MKKTLLLLSIVSGMGYLLLSNAAGSGTAQNGNFTGSPGSAGTCANATCHGASSSAVTGQYAFIDISAGGTPVINSKYVPTHLYEVSVIGVNTTGFAHFGFQTVALTSTNTQGGTFQLINSADPYNIVNLAGGIRVVEHKQVLQSPNPSALIAKFHWTAPTAGVGDITFHSMINAVNNNTTNDLNDKPSNSFTQTLSEQPASVADLSKDILISAYPNPVIDKFTISFNDAVNGEYTVTVMDVTGRKMHTQSVQVTGSKATASVEAAGWSSGLYFAQVVKDGAQRMLPLVKK